MAAPEVRADVASRDPMGQSLTIICRMLRGDNGEKLPHGRDTYQSRFRTLVNHEQVKPTTVFSKISGTQFGQTNILELEDLNLFDSELPRTAEGSQAYLDHEEESLSKYRRGNRDPLTTLMSLASTGHWSLSISNFSALEP